MTVALQIRGLEKRFGDVRALKGIDLTVAEGAVYGFLGPNGAGKTTTLRVITGLAKADGGSLEVFGAAPGTAAARSVTGFLPDVPGYYAWMTAEEFLRFVGGLFGIERKMLDARIAALLGAAGLSGVRTKIGGYSRGMKQRLGVAQALINAPRLLLLDEPTSALDPIGRRDVLEMIGSLKERTTVFFSTHVLADVERVCDTVAILDAGCVVAESSIDDLKASHSSHRIAISLRGPVQALLGELRDLEWVTSVDVQDETVRVNVTDTEMASRELPGMIAATGLGLERFELEEVSLEDVFMSLVGRS